MEHILFAEHIVDENVLNDLNDLLVKTNKRLAAKGFEPLTITVIGEEFVPINETESYKQFTIQLSGNIPKIGDYEFVAKLDHFQEGNIINKSPFYEEDIPEMFRTATSYCNHCNTNRQRNVTFVLKHKDGDFIQVGSSCLKDFGASYGTTSALQELWQALCKLQGWLESDEERSCGGTIHYDVRELLIWSIRVGETEGYVSRTKAQEDYYLVATVDLLPYAMNPKNETDKAFRDKVLKIENAEQKADAMLAWVESFEDRESLSDYEANLLVLVNAKRVEYKYAGYIASIPMAFSRAMAEKYHRDDPVSNHLGTIKEKLALDVTLTRLAGFYGTWGYISVLTFQTTEGDQLVWKASNFDTSKVEIGTKYHLVGTVKQHSEYKGTKQTELTRCKVTETDG